MNEFWRPRAVADTTATLRRPRSIVFLGTAHDNGGSSVLASTLAASMRAEGHRVEEWYLFGSNAELPAGARVFLNQRRTRSPLTLARLFMRVVLALRAAKPDAVFGLQPLSNLLAATAGVCAGVRERVGTHHLPHDQFNPVLMTIDAVAGRTGLYSHLVACGQSVADTYRRNGAAYMRRLTVIANGHKKPAPNDRATARAAFALPAKGPVLGQLGRLYHQKNQRFSIGLLDELKDASLLMIGSGPDEALVKAEIAARGLEKRAQVILHIAQERIGEFYSAIDIALFPSSFEGLSLAAIESIHAGVPLICSDIPSFREMFGDSPFLAQSLIVPLGDRAAWLARIRAILGDDCLRRQIATELRALSPRYDFATMATKYLQLVD